MSFINKFFIRLYAENVGEDSFGNQYYLAKKANYLNNKIRQVVYKGLAEPSKVPPEWHMWLHYLTDEIPKFNKNYPWQKSYLPNVSGTKFKYRPELSSGIKKVVYNRWQPK